MPRYIGSRLTKQWSNLPEDSLAMVAGGIQPVTELAFAEAGTVLRMIGGFAIGPTSAPTAGDSVIITTAIGVVSSDAAALGATAMPDPRTEPEYPWLYWNSQTFFFPTASADPTAPQSGSRVVFDIRSMRKLKPRESLVRIVEYTDLAGTPPMQHGSGPTRVLIGLH